MICERKQCNLAQCTGTEQHAGLDMKRRQAVLPTKFMSTLLLHARPPARLPVRPSSSLVRKQSSFQLQAGATELPAIAFPL